MNYNSWTATVAIFFGNKWSFSIYIRCAKIRRSLDSYCQSYSTLNVYGFKLDTLFHNPMPSTFHKSLHCSWPTSISWSTAFNPNKSLLYLHTAHNLAVLTHCIQRLKFNALTHWLEVSITAKSCSFGHNPPHDVIAVLTHSLYIFITARCSLRSTFH